MFTNSWRTVHKHGLTINHWVDVFGKITKLPSFFRVHSIAPSTFYLIIWISAIIMVAKTGIWKFFGSSGMLVRFLISPFLAINKFSCDGQISSVKFFSITKLWCVLLNNITKFPSNIRINGIAPSSIRPIIRIPTIVMFTQSFSWIIFWSIHVLVWILSCPIHTSVSIFSIC